MSKKEVTKEEKDDDETPSFSRYDKSNPIYHSNHSFYKYHNIKKLDNISFKSKYSFLVEFFSDLKKTYRLDPKKEHPKTRKKDICNTFSGWYNEQLEI